MHNTNCKYADINSIGMGDPDHYHETQTRKCLIVIPGVSSHAFQVIPKYKNFFTLSFLKYVHTPERQGLNYKFTPSDYQVPPSPPPHLINVKNLKKTELQALLKQNGVKFTANMTKSSLIKLWMKI